MFRNDRDETVNVWWADYAGKSVHYKSLLPGQYYKLIALLNDQINIVRYYTYSVCMHIFFSEPGTFLHVYVEVVLNSSYKCYQS